MKYEKLLSLLAMILGFVGTILLLSGVLTMTPDIIGEMGQTRYGYSTPVLQNLIIQKADTFTGFILIAIAFLIQFINEIFTFNRSAKKMKAITLLIVSSLIIVSPLLLVNNCMRNSNKLEAGKFLTKDYITRRILKENGQINWNLIKNIEEYADNLMNVKRSQGESDSMFLIRLGDFLDMDLRTKVLPKNDGEQ